MTGKEFRHVQDTIEQEGFDYTFTSYTDFIEIKDEEFHRLIDNFITHRKALADYIGCEE